jgi:2,3,4,5-tetrahydropyridine-2-carboxylate N-succinyltransferase
MERRGATATGLATITWDGVVLDTWFPKPTLTQSEARPGTSRLFAGAQLAALGEQAAKCLGRDEIRGVDVVAVQTTIASLADPPTDAHDAYLRLHLLSHRLIRPHQASLEGLFALLSTVAWTSLGPCPVDNLERARLSARAQRTLFDVSGVDKFPRMTDYVIPPNVRIADASRVRLGAHLAPGTTVMHEGFCNFNAGTLGVSMVEGRISAGVVVGEGTDIGGGASIMGTLSGGGKQVVSVGKRCLLGANSGIGISLGDDCVVEAGCYVTAGTRIRLGPDSVVKALELSGKPGLLFRRNSLTGAVEAIPRAEAWGSLNADVHRHN